MSAEGPIDVKHGVTHFTYDFPPGTEVVDPSGKEEHIHYPMPSNDPADPLNWSPKYKFMTFGALMMVCALNSELIAYLLTRSSMSSGFLFPTQVLHVHEHLLCAKLL